MNVHVVLQVNTSNLAYHISETPTIIYISISSFIASSRLARAQQTIQIDFDKRLWGNKSKQRDDKCFSRPFLFVGPIAVSFSMYTLSSITSCDVKNRQKSMP